MHGLHVWHTCRLHARQLFLPARESRPFQQRITDVVYRQLLPSTHAYDEAVWYYVDMLLMPTCCHINR